MSARLPSGMVVNALLRRVNDSGGIGMVRARGDEQGGAILIILLEQGQNPRVVERGIGARGVSELVRSGPDSGDQAGIEAYWRRRRERDPDLWIIELDIPFGERFAAETMLSD